MMPKVPTPAIWGADKVLHATEFAGWATLLVRALGPVASTRARFRWILLGALAGSVDEWIQRSTPGRSSSVWDLAADVVGVTLGVALAARIWRSRPFRGMAGPAWK